MFTTIDVHVHQDDTTIEVNEEGNGLVIRDVGSFDPRINLFFGNSKEEIRRNAIALINAAKDVVDRVTS